MPCFCLTLRQDDFDKIPELQVCIAEALYDAEAVLSNPSAFKPEEITTLHALARAHTPEAIETLLSIMRNKRTAASARVSAACALLDRAHGKPTQTLEHDMPVLEKDSPINVLVTARQVAVVLDLAKRELDRAESG